MVALLSFSSLEQGKAILESLVPWKKRPLCMNRDMSSSKVILSYDIYSHTYELEYSCYIIILIYELVYSLYVMKVAHLTLYLNIHITYIIGIRAKLRWRFIVPLGVPKFFTYRSIGSRTQRDLGSFYICKRGAWV